MKKLILIMAILLLSSSRVIAPETFTVKSFMKPGQASCYVNGQVMMPVTTDKSNSNLDQITFITAINNQTGKYIHLTGTWYDKDFNEIKSIQHGKNAYFVSDEYLLNSKGNYKIYLSYVPIEVISQVQYATSLKYDVICPGYKHSCEYIHLEIEKCYSDLDYFYAYFHGVGALHYSKVDAYYDIAYLLNYQGTSISYVTPMPRTRTIEELDNDSYILKIPRKDLRDNIDSIKIHAAGCIEGLYDVASFERCSFINESSKKEPAEVKKEEQKIEIDEKQEKIPLRYQQNNQTAQATEPKEEIDFVYKIINFFKRLFGFVKR